MEIVMSILTCIILPSLAFFVGLTLGKQGASILRVVARMEGVEYGMRMTHMLNEQQSSVLHKHMMDQVDQSRKMMGLNTEEEILGSMTPDKKDRGDSDDSKQSDTGTV
jgi:hypothetical protein